jgi:RNA 2',3'-cyclic 3'-phosphodiesterase
MAGSVSGDERLRLFLALTLPAATIDALADWQACELERGGQTARIVPRENLHITLAFLGSRPAGELPAILDVLGRAAADAEPVRFDVTGYRETRSVGMLTLGDEVGAAARLAGRLHVELAGLGVYRPEARPWLPHVTVLRFRERPRLRPEVPSLGWVSSDAAAFLSRLHPSGARYEVHDSFPLGG